MTGVACPRCAEFLSADGGCPACRWRAPREPIGWACSGLGVLALPVSALVTVGAALDGLWPLFAVHLLATLFVLSSLATSVYARSLTRPPLTPGPASFGAERRALERYRVTFAELVDHYAERKRLAGRGPRRERRERQLMLAVAAYRLLLAQTPTEEER